MKKRKPSDDSKKKKKPKKDGEVKEVKKKIKIEPEEGIGLPDLITKEINLIQQPGLVKEDSNLTCSVQQPNESLNTKKKEKVILEEKCPNIPEVCKQQEKSTSKSESQQKTDDESG